MNKAQKKQFIRDLIANVERDVLAKVEEMPEAWDGIEIREYITSKFADSTYLFTWSRSRKREGLASVQRARNYNNDVIVLNL